MQDIRSVALDVEVVYSVTGLSIGRRFTPVYTVTKTVQPGETWDAAGTWVPDVTGHHCIQARLTYDDEQQQQTITAGGSGLGRSTQIRTPALDCRPAPATSPPTRTAWKAAPRI